MGILVAIEGLDGAGKRTIVDRIRDTAQARGARTATFTLTRYGESITADLASEALHGEHGDLRDSVYAMALLFALDRAAAGSALKAACRDNDLVLCDRYVASNAAYSAARLGEDAGSSPVVDWVSDLEFGRFGLPVPDHQIVLGVPPEVAMARASGRAASDVDRPVDHYERDGGLQAAVYRAYTDLASANWMSDWSQTADDAAVSAVVSLLS